MRARLLGGLVAAATMLQAGVAVADESQPFIGFVQIPPIQAPLWHELVEQGGTRYADERGYLNLFHHPVSVSGPAFVIDSFDDLKWDSLEYEGASDAFVYDVIPGWFQLRMIDGTLVWVQARDTEGYRSFEEVLIGRPVALNSRRHSAYTEPDRLSTPAVLDGAVVVREVRLVGDTLWVRVKENPAHPEALPESFDTTPAVLPEDEGWLPARGSDGYPAFGMLLIC